MKGGACVVKWGGMHSEGGMCGEGGHTWQKGGVCGGGMCGREAYMAGGACVAGGMHSRRDGHCSGRYASYWNVFFFATYFEAQ